MNKITEVTRQDIIDLIEHGFNMNYKFLTVEQSLEHETQSRFKYYGRLDELSFILKLYDLKNLPSKDERYNNALEDIKNHLNNDDYEKICWMFYDDRFKLRDGDGDENLLRFICQMFHPVIRDEMSNWQLYFDKINDLLKVDGYELYEEDKISNKSVYNYRIFICLDGELLNDYLFTERYKDYIIIDDGPFVDNICKNLNYKTVENLCNVIEQFNESKAVQELPISTWVNNVDIKTLIINRFNDYIGYNAIDLNDDLECCFVPFIFDLIELQYQELSTIYKSTFRENINKIFKKNKLDFSLSERGLIELQNDNNILNSQVKESFEKINDSDLKSLIDLAFEKHMLPSSNEHIIATEKIWDALECLKTYYQGYDKKKSVKKLIDNMSNNNENFKKLFNDEFKTLTYIGNNYKIRHFEKDKIDIPDIRYYDYFFNRCLSLITLAINYIDV